MVQVDGTVTVCALTVIESPLFAEINPSISTFFNPGAAGGPGTPPLPCASETSPESRRCDPPSTTADGATGFIDDFESPHATAKTAHARTSDERRYDLVIASPVSSAGGRG